MADVDVVSVRIRPNSRTFRAELRSEMRAIDEDFKVTIKATIDKAGLTKARTQIENVTASAPVAKIKVEASPAQFRAEMDELVARTNVKVVSIDVDAKKAEDEIKRLTKNRFVLIDADAKIAKAQAQLDLLTAKDRKIRVDADANFLALNAALEEATRPRTIPVDIDTRDMAKAREFLKDIESSFTKFNVSSIPLVGSTKAVTSGVLSLGAALAKLTIGIAIIGALGTGAVQLAVGLAAASHAAGLLPGVLAGAGLAMVTIKLGADGIKKSIESLTPTLNNLKSAVSGAFVQVLKPAISQAKTLIPQLTGGFRELAASIGVAGLSLTTAFKSSNGIGTTNDLLKTTSAIARDLSSAFGPVAVGMLNIAKIGLEMFRPFTEGIGEAAARFSEFTRSAEGAQKIRDFIQKGIDAFRSLGEIASNIGQTISGVFRAIKTSSGGAFGGIKDITGAMRDFVNSADGQATLVSLFTSLRGVITAVLPIIKTLADIIGNTLAPVIADIATAIGPALNRMFQGLGEALKAASPGIVAIAEGFADLIDGLRPALPMLGEVAGALGTVLGDAIRNLAPPFLQLIQDLAPSLPGVADAVGRLALAGLKLLDAFTPLIDPLASVAKTLADTMLPVIDSLKDIIGPLARDLGTALVESLKKLAPVLPPLMDAFAKIVISLSEGLLPILPGLLSQIPILAAVFILLTPAVLALSIPFIITTSAAIAFMQVITGDLKGALGTMKSAFQTTGSITKTMVETDWAKMASDVLTNTSSMTGSAQSFADGVPGILATGGDNAAAALAGSSDSWTDITQRGIDNSLGPLKTGVQKFGPTMGEGMLDANQRMSDGWREMTQKAQGGVGDVTSTTGKLPPAMTNQFNGVPNSFSGIGGSMIKGLIGGINSLAGSAIATASGLASRLVGIMGAVLKINSPSKVVRDKIGVAIPQGLAVGIEKDAHLAIGAASSLANDVVSASSAAVDGVMPNFSSTLTVQQGQSAPIEIAANAAFDRVTAALEGWSVVLDPRGVATLSRAGAALNGKR